MIALVNLYGTLQDDKTIRLLYLWLSQRTPDQAISHREMPTYDRHALFVAERPYEAWYLIRTMEFDDPRYVGAIYLTKEREVGIHLDMAERGNGYGSEALAELRKKHPGRLLANINPKNLASIAFFKRHGARLLQHTYEL